MARPTEPHAAYCVQHTCSMSNATCTGAACSIQRRSMQLTTVQHAAYNMPHRPFGMQHELHMHSAIVQPTTRHPAAFTTCRMVFPPTDRWSGTHRRLQAPHQQGRATAGGLGSRARRGLRIRGVHPPSQWFGAVCGASRNDPPAWLQAVKNATHTSKAKEAARPRANWRWPKVCASRQTWDNTALLAIAACRAPAYAACRFRRPWLGRVCSGSSAA
jgi:hypothetical protein